jgi:hypothetical protein
LIPETKRLIVSDIMQQFSMPFTDMHIYAAKLFCAETTLRKKKSYSFNPTMRKKKSYIFNPTVLESSELRDYLNTLKEAKHPVREKFIVSAEHWIAGEIEIPETGNPRILFIDSLGAGEPKTHAIINQQCSNVFPQCDIYLSSGYHSSGKRQKSGLGCTIFSLKDAQDLYTIDRYLEPKYHGDIFEYAVKNSSVNGYLPMPVHAFPLPLRFMRTQQASDDLEKETIRRSVEEQSLVVNQKGEQALASAKKFFKKHTDKEGIEKIRNERLVYKLNKMAENVFDYLVDNQFDLSKIEADMEKFSLQALKQRSGSIPAATEQKEIQETSRAEESTESSGMAQRGLYFSGVNFGSLESSPFEMKHAAEDVAESVVITQANLNLIKIFQEKIIARFAYDLDSLIDQLADKYASQEITDIDSLKSFFKEDRTPVQQGYLEDIDDKVYQDLLQNLVILAESRQPKVTVHVP